jgi:GNAT superfamily N-acetyltransferase
MIKLTDLLKELDLRSGDLDDNITLEQVLIAFLEDFQIPEDEFFTVSRGKFNSEVFDLKQDATFNPKILKKTTLISDGDYEFIVPSSYRGTLYLVNTKGTTLDDYVIGQVEVEKIYINASSGRTKPYRIPGAEIHLTYVSPKYRGKGLGVKMYTMLLEAYKTIFSDNILYPGSWKLWISKLAPIGLKQGNFIGGEVGGIIVPFTPEDISDASLMEGIGVDHLILSTEPPQVLLDIKQALSGLSLSKGDYGIYEMRTTNLKVAQLDEIVDQVGSIEEVIEEAGLVQVVGLNDDDNYSTIVVATQDALAVIREVGDDVTLEIV